MRQVSLIVAAFAMTTVLAPVGSLAAPESYDVRAFSDYVFESLGAQPFGCPQNVLDTLEEEQRADCASLDLSFAQFKKSWQRFVSKQDRFQLGPAAGWHESGPYWKKRLYTVGVTPVWVAFSERNRGLMLTYGKSLEVTCDEESPEEASLPYAGTAGTSTPELIRRVDPDLPVGGFGREWQGVVALKVRVGRTGRPTVLCVLDATPKGLGFEEAAIVAVERWRYKPAIRGGEPVEVALVVTVTWR